MDYLIYWLIFTAGVLVGFLLRVFLNRFSHYTGAIVVSKVEGKTVYSLVLEDYPEKIELRKHVLFRVVEDDRE
jgi:hypothetical protein